MPPERERDKPQGSQILPEKAQTRAGDGTAGAMSVTPPHGNPSTMKPLRGLLLWVAAVAVVWWGCLIGMSLATANPVILSCAQIQRSEVVVTARRLPDGDPEVISIEQVEFGKMPRGTARVHRLSSIKMPVDQLFILPLSMETGRLEVTRLPTQDPRSAARIYPATPEAKTQLQQCLAGR